MGYFVQLNKQPIRAEILRDCFYWIKWSERQDLNLRPLHPQFSGLPKIIAKLMKLNETSQLRNSLRQQIDPKIKDSLLFFVQLNKTDQTPSREPTPTSVPLSSTINNLTLTVSTIIAVTFRQLCAGQWC